MTIHFAEIVWSDAPRYWLANARIPGCLLANSAKSADSDHEGVVRVDVLVEHGKIARVMPAQDTHDDAIARVDLGGRQIWPTLIDVHTHLDKGHSIERNPNIDGTFNNARLAAAADRPNWTAPDLRRRMGFGLRCAHAHGVSAIRTHIDTYHDSAERSWPVLREMREEWAGRVDLQAVSLCPIELLMDSFGDRVAEIVKESGGLLGGVTRPAIGMHGAPQADIDRQLDRLFALAARHDLDIDLHVDETDDPAAATLPFIARSALRHGYKGRVVCGHCCSLAMQGDSEIDRTLDLLAEADISIVTLPTVNMYLQDRCSGRTPRWRGVTVVHEMIKRGIRVAAAGDNCRDSFYAYGDHDMVDTFRQAVRILHFDHPLSEAPSLVASTPSRIAKLEGHGSIGEGAPARLIVFNARSLNEIVSRPQADRVVLEGGRRITAKPPDYSELWPDDDLPGRTAAAE
ncbi:cytosine deaminase [Bradyrhizobium sp. NAS96.2]|uniref:cytosine deaminase n=1 Tax=Bradyrhizobium sp. NAS96.2 TaxID=1680160 RepID=UPI00093D148F|nr:cytosine deaminase [Bradyrhizobium sp. NAS96.2]